METGGNVEGFAMNERDVYKNREICSSLWVG